MKALSVKQPWAWLICRGIKDIENRTWFTRYHGDLLIHASLELDDKAWDYIHGRVDDDIWAMMWDTEFINNLPRGAIVGQVMLTRIMNPVEARMRYQTKWAVGPYCWHLTNAWRFARPITYKGRLRLFEVDYALINRPFIN